MTLNLNEIELAVNAPLPEHRQRQNLEEFADKRYFSMTYAPVRACFADIFQIATMFGPHQRTERARLQTLIERRCSKRKVERQNNVQFGLDLHDFAVARNIKGTPVTFGSMRVAEADVAYWVDCVLEIDGRATVAFIDPRRTNALGDAEACHFVFSMMDAHIRQQDPDFAAFDLAILQRVNDQVVPCPIPIPSMPLLSFAELEDMVSRTLQLWQEVQLDRLATRLRRTA